MTFNNTLLYFVLSKWGKRHLWYMDIVKSVFLRIRGRNSYSRIRKYFMRLHWMRTRSMRNQETVFWISITEWAEYRVIFPETPAFIFFKKNNCETYRTNYVHGSVHTLYNILRGNHNNILKRIVFILRAGKSQ